MESNENKSTVTLSKNDSVTSKSTFKKRYSATLQVHENTQEVLLLHYVATLAERQGGKQGGRQGGRGGKEGGRQGGREGGREGRKEGWREGGREGGR